MSDTSLFGQVYNPDVLTCIANLSNDEVFTPPKIAKAMLDMLPQELFENPNTKFLDPACKSGVFLREITKRLIKGLEKEIPVLEERIDHILQEQVYGIAMTELTSLMTRRSLYCSKYPNSKYSISHFDTAEGNIRYIRTQHTWENGRCVYCGANKRQYERGEELETHAYEFIHTLKPEDIFKMKFDVIIGNPPYQMSTGGGQAQAIPLYDKFVTQSIKLNPKFISMIIPARWYAGGFPAIKKFREQFATSNQLRIINDFTNAGDCFSNVEIKGGICYFLWDKDYKGLCNFINRDGKSVISERCRYLLEKNCDTVIRDNNAINILHKVMLYGEKSIAEFIGPLWPFTTKSTFSTLTMDRKNSDDIYAYVMKNQGWIRKSEIQKNIDLVYKYKLLLPRSVGSADVRSDRVKPIVAEPNTCGSGTYIVCGPFDSKEIAENVKSYFDTKFFHFLLSLKKVSQDTVRGCYEFIPVQDFSKRCNDREIYRKYAFSQNEIDYIENMVWSRKEG